MRSIHLFWTTFAALAGIASAATYTWTGGAGDCLFSTAGNWDGNAAPTAATAADTLEFTVGGIASNDIANLTVGDISVSLSSGAELTLGGEQKIGGSGTLTLDGDGTGRLVFDATGGLDEQPIIINAGVFKVGDSLTGSALGSAADTAPITVNAGGTLDVNYFDTTTVVDYPRAQVTHDKLIRIAGAGAPGAGGAIINGAPKNGGNTMTIGDLVLLADATIGGSNRVDITTLVDDNGVTYGTRANHASVSGDYVLTVADAGPTRARYKGIWNCTVNVKSITVTAGAELLFGNDVTFTLSDGVLNLVDGGKICSWGQNYHFQYPIVVTGSNNRIRSGSGTGYFDGALTVSDGNVLTCSGGTVNFYGAVAGDIANTGAQLHFYTKVHGNTSGAAAGNTTHFHGGLDGIVTLKGNNSAAGQAVFYPDTSCFHGYFRTNGEGYIDGRTGEYFQTKNNILAGAPMSLTVIGGITVNGQHNFGTYSDSIANAVLITNSTINVTEAFSAGRVGPREAGNHSIARLGNGATVTAAYVLTGYNMWPNYGAIELLNGAVVNATNRVCAGYHSGQTTIPKCYGVTNANEWITVDGGTLNADGIGIGIGFRGPQSRFFLKNGTVNAKGFYFQAFRAKDADVSGGGLCVGGTNTFRFVMSGGTLNLGSWGFESWGREDNSEANVILAGGTLNAKENFSIPYYNPTLFGTWRGGSPGGFTLNTAGHTVTLNTALNGMGDVKLTGAGTVVGTNAMQGVLGGKWTVDSGMTADLRGAASLLGGLSAETNANVMLDVGVDRSAAFFSRDGSWPLGGADSTVLDRFNKSDGGTVSTLVSHDMGLLSFRGSRPVNYMGGTREALLAKGEFYVAPEEAGTWTFSGTYDNHIYIQIDDQKATSANSTAFATVQIALSAGWHRFILVGEHTSGNVGPASWPGMAVGYAKSAVSGTAQSDYTPFDPKHIRMRPSSPAGGEASVRWSTVRTTAWSETAWTSIRAASYTNSWDWDAVSLTNSLKASHWYGAQGSSLDRLTGSNYIVNRWDGWFLVPFEKAGTWRFRLKYNNRIRFYLDGKDLGVESATDAVTVDKDITPGWHRYEIRTYRYNKSSGPGANDYAVSYAVSTDGGTTFGEYTPFDEDSLTLSLAPDGYLQGEIALASGARVTNVSDEPALVYGDISADGAAGAVMSGKFACVSNTVDFGTVAADTDDLTEVLRFDNAATNLFADVGRIAVNFAARPTRGTVVVGPAGGLEALSGEALAQRLSVTVNGVPAESVRSKPQPMVENGELRLHFALGTMLMIR